jgi:hypothetical protein
LKILGSDLFKNKIDRHDETEESREMVPVEVLTLEEKVGDEREDDERHHFLDDFQLHKGERPAVTLESDAVGWHLHAIFGESDNPGEGDDSDEWPSGGYMHLLQFEMTIPCQCHENVGSNQQANSKKTIHFYLIIDDNPKTGAKLRIFYVILQKFL